MGPARSAIRTTNRSRIPTARDRHEARPIADRASSPPLILASGSPRRRELLGRFGIPFHVMVSDASEAIDSALDPEDQAFALAQRKAQAIGERLTSGLVLGADTIVALDGEVLGKPRDDADAISMLRSLSGRDHRVVTGVALVDADSGETRASAVLSTVQFRPLTDDEIARYVASGEPRDKAGAYAIQGLGATLIGGFDGCYTNVVGLPLCETARLLDESGLPVSAATPVCLLPEGTPCPRLV